MEFYIYLLTNNQRNIAGYYKINPKYVALDMGIDKRKVETILSRHQKYWVYDKDTNQVLIPKFTRYNIVKSKQQMTALNAELAKLHPCHLHKLFLEAFEGFFFDGFEHLAVVAHGILVFQGLS